MITKKKSDTNTSNRYEAIMDQVVTVVMISTAIWSLEMNIYDYFFESSPIKAISSFNIGSRPAARKTITEIGGLRAIPWASHGHKAVSCFLDGGVGSSLKNLLIKIRRISSFFVTCTKTGLSSNLCFPIRHGFV